MINNQKINQINIIPGSYKPPHKGHLSLIESIIDKYIKSKSDNKLKIIILISKKPRTLDKRLQFYEQKTKEELQKVLINTMNLSKRSIHKKVYSEKNTISNNKEIVNMKKNQLINKIEELINKDKIPIVTPEQSLKVWKIYINYLKNKYKKIVNENKFPQIILKISETNNIIQYTASLMLKLLRENKPEKVILMKSEKNRNNKRFNFLLKGSLAKYINISIFPNIKDIDARDMREAILHKDLIKFNQYLPNDLSDKDKKNIWKIVKL